MPTVHGILNEMERDYMTAQLLDALNRETREENAMQSMVREARGGWLRIVREHLEEYLDGADGGRDDGGDGDGDGGGGRDDGGDDGRNHGALTYEGWIALLHPENAAREEEDDDDDDLGRRGRTSGGGTAPPIPVIDHRFYVADSDHRRLWNESLAERGDGDRRAYVPARKVRPWGGRGNRPRTHTA